MSTSFCHIRKNKNKTPGSKILISAFLLSQHKIHLPVHFRFAVKVFNLRYTYMTNNFNCPFEHAELIRCHIHGGEVFPVNDAVTVIHRKVFFS